MQYLLMRRRRHRATYLSDINIVERVRRSTTVLAVLFAVHTLLMMYFESLSLGDAIWLTLTTATTVGYGDISATTAAGRVSTVVLLYFGGIFVLANLAGEYFEGRLERKNRMLKGTWEWSMSGHIVIINTPIRGGTQYFVRLVSQLRKNQKFSEIPIQILTRQYPDGLPVELRNLGVVHFSGNADNREVLEQINVRDAAAIVVLAKDEYATSSDALTFDVLHRIKECGVEHVQVLAEVVNDDNRNRFSAAGADIVVRPIRAYPEIIVRALVAPGFEKVLENLFQHEGDHTIRYDLPVSGYTWGQVVSKLVNKGFGTAMAYVDQMNEPICNADPSTPIDAKAIIVMVRADRVPSQRDIRALLLDKQSTAT